LFDIIIVGSGPAGVAAARKLTGLNVMMLDVGNQPPDGFSHGTNFYDMKKNPSDYFEQIIGTKYESLNNIDNPTLMPKIKAPYQRYVTNVVDQSDQITSDSFDTALSYAKGGLANIWGAQLYRYNQNDLQAFPINSADLKPYYDDLTNHIGISGGLDDLSKFYGTDTNLLPTMKLNRMSMKILQNYQKKKNTINQKGVYIGFPRLGILTKPQNNRPKYNYDNTEFFWSENPAVYSPVITLQSLLDEKSLEYKSGYYVLSYSEQPTYIEVKARSLTKGSLEIFRTKKLLLAAGTLSTTRIVLRSNNDFETRLPLLENLLSYTPLVHPAFLGSPLQTDCFYSQLNLYYEGHEGEVMGSFYSVNGLLHADLIFDLPFAVRSNLMALRSIIPAMQVLHLWYPSTASADNWIKLQRSGELNIHFSESLSGMVEKKLIQILRKLGLYSHKKLCGFPKPGNSFHYAGTLPMTSNPTRYQTNSDGLLYGTKSIYVIDGSILPTLSAKNLSFTIMANSSRIADHIRAITEVA